MPDPRGARPGAACAMTGVTFAYPGARRPALDGVTIEVGTGELTAFIGPNGAGKSTLIRLLGGTLSPAEGSVALLGRDLADWSRSALARRMAVVSQDAPPDAIPIVVREYVELGRTPYVSPWTALAPEDVRAVDQAIARADLEALASRPLSSLSGGERQRAKLARALAQEPELLILDEPTAHLDVGHALWIFDVLRGLVEAGGMTVICVTHDMHLASRFAGRVVLLADGRIRAEGPPEDVLVPGALADAYRCEVRVEAIPGLGRVVLPVHGVTDAGGR